MFWIECRLNFESLNLCVVEEGKRSFLFSAFSLSLIAKGFNKVKFEMIGEPLQAKSKCCFVCLFV